MVRRLKESTIVGESWSFSEMLNQCQPPRNTDKLPVEFHVCCLCVYPTQVYLIFDHSCRFTSWFASVVFLQSLPSLSRTSSHFFMCGFQLWSYQFHGCNAYLNNYDDISVIVVFLHVPGFVSHMQLLCGPSITAIRHPQDSDFGNLANFACVHRRLYCWCSG